jgi:hypothetical protein
MLTFSWLLEQSMGARKEWLAAILTALCLGTTVACSSDGDSSPQDDARSVDDAAGSNSDGVGVAGDLFIGDGSDAMRIDGLGGPDSAGTDTTGPCVPQSFTLAFVGSGGGSACSFEFNKPYTPGSINLVLTPGWGTVCYAGSSQNCGSGASADGWWISAGKIYLCDATCSRFYKQTTAGKLTVELGCPTESCTH